MALNNSGEQGGGVGWPISSVLPLNLLPNLSRMLELGALGGHALRVSAYAYVTAQSYGLHDRVCERLRQAAAFHDIGKSLISEAVLNKRGRLNPAERHEVEYHTVRGYELLLASNVPTLREAAVIAYCHHEHLDGSGYPRGRSGDEIPLAARIVAVADVFDALTSHRLYRPALSEAEALTLLEDARDRQFDGTVLDAFRAALAAYPDLGQRLRWFTHSVSEPTADAVYATDYKSSALNHIPKDDVWLATWLEPEASWSEFKPQAGHVTLSATEIDAAAAGDS